jgi:hypothetical protein
LRGVRVCLLVDDLGTAENMPMRLAAASDRPLRTQHSVQLA